MAISDVENLDAMEVVPAGPGEGDGNDQVPLRVCMRWRHIRAKRVGLGLRAALDQVAEHDADARPGRVGAHALETNSGRHRDQADPFNLDTVAGYVVGTWHADVYY